VCCCRAVVVLAVVSAFACCARGSIGLRFGWPKSSPRCLSTPGASVEFLGKIIDDHFGVERRSEINLNSFSPLSAKNELNDGLGSLAGLLHFVSHKLDFRYSGLERQNSTVHWSNRPLRPDFH
jgi:hypothetical protein